MAESSGGKSLWVQGVNYCTVYNSFNFLLQIVLLEASDRFGGWIRTTKLDNGAIFEQGPRTIRGTGPAANATLNLVTDFNLFPSNIGIGSTVVHFLVFR